jgi:K+-sensing histidine kinase KdpD
LLIEESPRITSNEILDLANSIRMGTLQLQTLVDNLLESATIEAGNFQVHCRPTHLQGIIEKASEAMAPLLKRRNQRLELDIQSNLPSIWADPERLIQVFINLLANASKFGPMGMEITISVYRDNDTIMIAVLDLGPGLPAGRFSDLFKRFVTGGQPRQAQYGVGLGLSVVKAIVEAHGGQVGAENRVEGGAKVWFTLPINPQEEC